MRLLESFSKNLLLPVNVRKTKAMLEHSDVSPTYPKVFFENDMAKTASIHEYLEVVTCTKMGWSYFIRARIMKVRNIYYELRRMFRAIPIEKYYVRKKLSCICAASLLLVIRNVAPFHREAKTRNRTYCKNLRLIYNLWRMERPYHFGPCTKQNTFRVCI